MKNVKTYAMQITQPGSCLVGVTLSIETLGSGGQVRFQILEVSGIYYYVCTASRKLAQPWRV